MEHEDNSPHHKFVADRFCAELHAAEVLSGKTHDTTRDTMWPDDLEQFVTQLSRNGVTLSVHITK